MRQDAVVDIVIGQLDVTGLAARLASRSLGHQHLADVGEVLGRCWSLSSNALVLKLMRKAVLIAFRCVPGL